MSSRVVAIVPAAGLGTRFGAGRNKPLFPILGRPLVAWTLQALQSSPEIDEIVPVFKADDLKSAGELIEEFGITKVRQLVRGGRERQDSVYNALMAVGEATVAVIHDGARPMVDHDMIRCALAALADADGAVVAVPVKDTIKTVGSRQSAVGNQEDELFIQGTLDRNLLWAIQTPQVFPWERIRDAYVKARREDFCATDDAALMERYGGRVRVVMGSYRNIKVTTPDDIVIAEAFLSGK